MAHRQANPNRKETQKMKKPYNIYLVHFSVGPILSLSLLVYLFSFTKKKRKKEKKNKSRNSEAKILMRKIATSSLFSCQC